MRRSLVAAALAFLLAGCAAPTDRVPSVAFSHVHGLGYDPTTGDLLVATHHGLVRGQNDNGWTWDYAGSERYDYMGFAQDAVHPDVLYSSGHPDDPRAYGGVHLGLRRSTDGGVTWEQRSLKGAVDFHGLAAIPGVGGGLVGIWRDTLMESRDGGLTWVNHTGPAPLMFGVTVTEHRVYVATADGLASGHLGDPASWQRHADPEAGRPAMAIAASSDGSLLFAGTGNGRSGATYVSDDDATSWRKLADPLLAGAAVPAVFAFDPADPGHVFAASSAGAVLESRDAGSTWTALREA